MHRSYRSIKLLVGTWTATHNEVKGIDHYIITLAGWGGVELLGKTNDKRVRKKGRDGERRGKRGEERHREWGGGRECETEVKEGGRQRAGEGERGTERNRDWGGFDKLD